LVAAILLESSPAYGPAQQRRLASTPDDYGEPRGCTLNVAGEQRQDHHQEGRHTESLCHELPARHGLRILTFATCELAQNGAHGSIPTLDPSSRSTICLKCCLRLPIWEFRENLETHGHHEVCWRSLLPRRPSWSPDPETLGPSCCIVSGVEISGSAIVNPGELPYDNRSHNYIGLL
jgi:hypothetical protein